MIRQWIERVGQTRGERPIAFIRLRRVAVLISRAWLAARRSSAPRVSTYAIVAMLLDSMVCSLSGKAWMLMTYGRVNFRRKIFPPICLQF